MDTKDLEYDGYNDLLIGNGKCAVVVVPDYHAFTPYAQREAEGFAADGRVGVLMDLFGERMMPRTGGDAFSHASPMMEDRSLGVKRLQACVDHLHDSGIEKIVLVGYSCGGLFGLDAARTGMNVDGVVSIWGLLEPMVNMPQVMRPVPDRKVPVLAIQGGHDELAPPSTYASFADEMNAIGVDWQLHLMGTAKHAFSLRQEDNLEIQSGEQPTLLLYDENADRRSRELTTDFLDEIFA